MEEAIFNQFVKRPSTCDIGAQIKVRANFFEVTKMQDTNISQYEVNITPTVPQRLNRRVFNRFVEQYRERALGGARPVYDGRAIVFTHKPLPFETRSFEVELEEDNAPVGRARIPRRFTIRIRKTREIFMGDLFRFLNGRGDMTNNCQMAMVAMDIIISHKISTVYPTVRRSFYTPQLTKSLSGGIEAWQGYFQSARPTRGRMMINIDLSTTAFYESGPLINVVANILKLRSLDDLRRNLSESDRFKVEDIISGLRITDNHRTGNRRKFKIEGLTEAPASHATFPRDDGSRIDVRTYFQNQYNRRLLYPFLPCVIVRRNQYLPIEVCDVIREQRYMRKLIGKQTEDMMNFARQNPNVRANKIQDGLNILNYRDNEYLQQFGMSISNNMTVVNARILPTPTIQYHPTSRERRIEPKGGVWNLRDKKVATGATLGSWSVLAFLNERDLRDNIIEGFLIEFVDTCIDTGMNIPNKRPPICRENPIGNTEESLKKAWLRAGNNAKAQPQLILCILPNNGTELYGEIKRISETVIGVATQCLQSVHMRRPKKQYCANVCLKVNVKLGGMNSFLIPEHLPFVSDEPTILIGADVSHPGPGPGETGKPSFAALCGSMDARASRYAASIRVQAGRVEIIVDMANMVKELLKTFYQTCGRKPERILFYRDGISEGQFGNVLQNEFNAIRAACQALDAQYKPTITFIVVQKRHHTRLFPMDRQNTDRSGNCLPGTVVDVGITHPFEFDFYLLSHAGLLGTSRPAHYHVLYDENGFDANRLQTLSYNLCYIFVRCTRAVSLVPPVYYAHLVTTRAKCHTCKEPDGEETFGVVKQDLQRAMYFV
ncbi:Piwi domain-containing protein [Rhizophagus diaphanus]|nr:Piwi domain-containing protein [Rhizophagus diaphanus] [Rhizophagus sp. MUCL 43196]